MYAVIATGGKQYRVTKDAVLRVEKLDAEPGATVEFGEVLLVGEGADVKVGKPTLKGGKVLSTGTLAPLPWRTTVARTLPPLTAGWAALPSAPSRTSSTAPYATGAHGAAPGFSKRGPGAK